MTRNDDDAWHDQITESQRTCLRLVGEGMSSKEIAQKTGLSYRTVDQYINQAARTLGAANRREAARILASHDLAALKKLQLKPEGVVNVSISSEQMGVGQGGQKPDKLPRFLRWIPPIGGERHELNATGVTRDIVFVSILTMGAATGIITVVFWLNKYFT